MTREEAVAEFLHVVETVPEDDGVPLCDLWDEYLYMLWYEAGTITIEDWETWTCP